MKFLEQFNQFLERWMPLVTPACLLVGVLLPEAASKGLLLVPWVFAFMTFSGGLKSSFRDIKDVFRRPLPLLAAMAALHIAVPLLSAGVGHLLFPGNPSLITGLVLEFTVPSAVVSVMWTTMYGGNIPLALSTLVIDTLITPFTLPVTLKLLAGSGGQVDAAEMIRQLIFMVALPALAAMLLNLFTGGRSQRTLPRRLAPFSKMAMIFVVTCNSSKVAPYVRHMTWQLLGVTAAVFCVAAAGYGIGWLLGRLLRQPGDIIVTLTFSSGMRNISAGAVLAAAYFPAEVMFPVMIGTLFQQVLAACYGALLRRFQLRER